MVCYVEARLVSIPQPIRRIAVTAAALAIIYLGTSITFNAPQMWGEDITFFLHAKMFGFRSLSLPEAGYLSFAQSFVAVTARAFKAQLAAKIYFYASITLTLLVVWLVTSPRLSMPSKPALALAVVVVPMGFEELGTLTNIQWILPIGGLVLLFMTPPNVRWIGTCAEALFLIIMALSGPFSIFMAPMFVALAFQKVGFERKRLVILSVAVVLGALTQICIILSLHQATAIEPTEYPWSLWITLPTRQILTVIPGLAGYLNGPTGIAAGALLFVLAVIASFTGPYRNQKRCLILLSFCIALGGMLKFRAALDNQTSATRYFYLGSISVLWILCCVSETRSVQRILTLIVVATEVALLPAVASTPRTVTDFNWPSWARAIDSGLPVIIPTAPGGWYTLFPANPNGPLYRYSRWSSRTLTAIKPAIDATLCVGTLDEVEKLTPIDTRKLWHASGSIGDDDHPSERIRFIALVDQEDRVIGFGYIGFRMPEETLAGGATGWRSIFFSDAKRVLRAYGVTSDGTACPLSNEVAFGADRKPIASGTLVEALPLLAGARVTQRFSAKHGLRGVAVRFVTWGKVPNAYPVAWHVIAHRGEETFDLGSGRLNAGSIADWQTVTLALRRVPEGIDQVECIFEVSPDASVVTPLGLPLGAPIDADAEPADVDGQPSTSGGSVNLSAISDP